MTFNIGGRRFVVDNKLGEGAFGKVYKVRDNNNLYYAVKEIQVTARSGIANVEREINALKTCDEHQGTVKLFDIDFTDQKVLILMEYCEGGNLNNRLANTIANEQRDLRWMSELADAVRFLHSKRIVHRDLKPENVLLTSNDAIKLGDFGLAREYTALTLEGAISVEAYVQHMTSYMGTQCGTPYWMAPEVFEGHYNETADVFSLGAIFYTIVTRQYILISGEKFFGAFITVRGQRYGVGQAMSMSNSPEAVTPPFDDNIKRSRKELILRMLKYNTEERPNASQVYDHVENTRNDVIRLSIANTSSWCC